MRLGGASCLRVRSGLQECQELLSVTRKAVLTPRGRKKRSSAAALQKRRLLVFEEAANFGEGFGVHAGGDAAGLGVLLAGVVDAKEARGSGRDFGFGAVSESVERAGSDHSTLLEDVEVGVPRDFAERQDCFGFKNLEFALQIIAAIQDFSRERFIVRRGAAAGCGDVCVFELQAVVAVKGSGLVRETCFVQGGVKKIAGAIPGEHAAGAIRAMRRGGES